LVVHGSDGLDELTITGDTYAAYLRNGMIESTTIVLRDITQRRATLADLKGGDAEHNAQAIRRLFEGEEGPFHDIVALNAGAALRVAGLVHSLGDGMMMASMAIADGGARNALDKLIEASNA
jgi:anthranilate phosphoribosyltransferase